jgi:UDP-N-acetylglucosamine 2-epimerase
MLKSNLADWRPASQLLVTGPLSYLDMLALIQGARWVLTDSGGLQKEAYFLKCPCITLRDETEWLETLHEGANSIAGSDGRQLAQRLSDLRARPRTSFGGFASENEGPFGNGRAAERIVEAVCALCGPRQ